MRFSCGVDARTTRFANDRCRPVVARETLRQLKFRQRLTKAAGIAAAVAIDDDVNVRAVSVPKVQEIPRSIGMPLHGEQIV